MSHQFCRKMDVNDTYDVIVAGGGPAGCAAAAAAAREGANTLLLERTGMLGGAATAGLVSAWTPFSDGIRIIYSGLAATVFNRTKAKMYHVDPDRLDWVSIDPEALKIVYDELMKEYGVHVLFQSMVCDVEMKDEGIVDNVIVSNKAGLTAYHAKIFIDCTGDGDVSYWSGAHCWMGDDNGEVQAASHCFVLSNVDQYGFNGNGKNSTLHPANPESPIHKIVNDDAYCIKDKHCCSSFHGPATMGFNAGHIWGIDATNPESTTAGLFKGRKIANDFRDALAKYRPKAFANAFLTETAPSLGIRESRRVEGDYVFTAKDYFERKSFPDEICRNNYFIDVHGVDETKNQMNPGWDPDDAYEHYKDGESYGIPYRCLTPKGLKNVLTAGRIISSDQLSQGSLRIMPACLSTGEAAGIAAAYSLKMDTPDVHKVDTSKVRSRMKEEGAYLP